MRRRHVTLALGSFLAAAALTACTAGVPSVPQAVADPAANAALALESQGVMPEHSAAVPTAPAQAAVSVAPAAVSPAAVSFEEALAVVQEQLPDSLPLSCSLDTVSGQLVWDIELLTADGVPYETAVNAQDAALVYAKIEDDQPEMTRSEIAVDCRQAIQAAHNIYPDCYLESFSLERENGRAVYEVEMRTQQGTDHEVVIDAATGEIVGLSANPAVQAAPQDSMTAEAALNPPALSDPATAGDDAASCGSGSQSGWRHHAENGHHAGHA